MKPISFWHRLFDLISPRLCVVCGHRLSVSEEIICTKCNLHLPRTGFHRNAYENVMAKLFWGQIPIERAELESKLKAHDQIVVSDSIKTYMLQTTQKHLRGEQMPIDYARPQIEKIVLNTRQVEFLNKERERLYNEAIQNKKIKFYEN